MEHPDEQGRKRAAQVKYPHRSTYRGAVSVKLTIVFDDRHAVAPFSMLPSLLNALSQHRIQFVQRLRHHVRVGEHGHEVGVPVPTGNDVYVKVVDDARSGAAAKIDTDIESLGLHGFGQQLLAVARQPHQIAQFLIGKVVQLPRVLVRRDHQMAGVVGKRVQQRETIALADDNVVPGVIRLLRFPAKEATLLLFSEDVPNPPRRPQMFHPAVIEPAATQVNTAGQSYLEGQQVCEEVGYGLILPRLRCSRRLPAGSFRASRSTLHEAITSTISRDPKFVVKQIIVNTKSHGLILYGGTGLNLPPFAILAQTPFLIHGIPLRGSHSAGAPMSIYCCQWPGTHTAPAAGAGPGFSTRAAGGELAARAGSS